MDSLIKKILSLLKMISTDEGDIEIDSEKLLDAIDYDEEDLADIGFELEELESSDNLDEVELDILKALLVYILIRDSSYEEEDIFSFVFGGGHRILWN